MRMQLWTKWIWKGHIDQSRMTYDRKYGINKMVWRVSWWYERDSLEGLLMVWTRWYGGYLDGMNKMVSWWPYRLYYFLQGLYDSIRDASALQRPIYITETGCADKTGKYRRQLIEAHCQEVVRSIADGFDVRGMYYWWVFSFSNVMSSLPDLIRTPCILIRTLMDNIEWHEGFHIKFGWGWHLIHIFI